MKKPKNLLAKSGILLPFLMVPAFAGSFKVADFLCSVYHTIGANTTGYSLITVVLLLGALGFIVYAIIISVKEKKFATIPAVIALVLIVLTTTWGGLIDTISQIIGFQPFIETPPTGGSVSCSENT